ncbi:MAG: TonB-dependent receptor, partial [Gemmatimonadetes bacterium]|nr:TonB-dependent receptor [Gemmatimonadota bacterium]
PKRSASITGQVVRARGTVSAVLSLAGKREDVDFAAGFPAPRVTLPGYRTLDLSAAYRLPFAHGAATQLRLKVENLLDTDYEGIAGFPAPGRIIRIGTTVQLGG